MNKSKANEKPISISKTLDEHYKREAKEVSLDIPVVDISEFLKANKQFCKDKADSQAFSFWDEIDKLVIDSMVGYESKTDVDQSFTESDLIDLWLMEWKQSKKSSNNK